MSRFTFSAFSHDQNLHLQTNFEDCRVQELNLLYH